MRLPCGQDPLWARLLVAALPSVFALILAWLVFHLNRKNDHRRWVLENKKAEWQELLTLASKIEVFMPSVAIGVELISAVHDPIFNQHVRDMTRATLKCVFISQSKTQKIYQMFDNIQIKNEQAKAHIEDHRSDANLAHTLGKPRPLQAAKQIQSELGSLRREVRRFASDDLSVEQRQRLPKSIGDWIKGLRRPQADGNAATDAPGDAL